MKVTQNPQPPIKQHDMEISQQERVDLREKSLQANAKTLEESNEKAAKELKNNEKDEQKPDVKTLIKTIEEANNFLDASYNRFEFSIHESTKRIMVKVINLEDDEIVREIPPEKLLDIVANIWEMAGIIVDEKR